MAIQAEQHLLTVDASSPYFALETVTVKAKGDLVKTNYHFTGWDTVQSGGGDSYTGSGSETFIMPASNVILYAQWEVDTKYSVTYNGNGNTGGTAPVECRSNGNSSRSGKHGQRQI